MRRSILWDCLAGVAAGFLVALLVLFLTSCGSSARMDASELIAAELTILDRSGGAEPTTISLDLSAPAIRERPWAMYELMTDLATQTWE